MSDKEIQPEDEKQEIIPVDAVVAEEARAELVQKLSGPNGKKYARFVMAALGSIPWVGGVISAAAALHAEKDQEKVNALQKMWLQEHEEKIQKLRLTLSQIFERFDAFGDEVRERIESEEYLTLIRRGFRSWDQADTEEKRQLVRKLLANAGVGQLCPDDLIRLFISWIDLYHEAHFLVIREIYRNPGASRGEIWDAIHGARPREDSAEADLFKLLIRDLSTGSVIRQDRETNTHGQFVRRTTRGPRPPARDTMKSAFDDEDPYVLTELGQQFVHYTMEEVVPRIEAGGD